MTNTNKTEETQLQTTFSVISELPADDWLILDVRCSFHSLIHRQMTAHGGEDKIIKK
jgi:hypothetical protein